VKKGVPRNVHSPLTVPSVTAVQSTAQHSLISSGFLSVYTQASQAVFPLRLSDQNCIYILYYPMHATHNNQLIIVGSEVLTAVSTKMAIRPDDGGSKDL
jgi:hypothetical protein